MKFILIILVLITHFSNAQSNSVKDWVKANAIRMEQSFGMRFLTEKNDIQIIGFGEASHGQGSFFKHKINSFKWLVQNAGYLIFVLEAGFNESLKINQYVLYGEGSATEGLKYLNYGVWQIEEFVELIEWMRTYNKDKSLHEQVKFYGFDCQMSKGGVDYLKSIQGRMDYNFNDAELQLLKDLEILQSSRDKRLAKNISPRLLSLSVKLEQKILEANQNETFKKTSLTVLKNLQYFCDTERNNEKINALNRAKYMAENIGHILEMEGKVKKIAFSAHNGHLTKYAKQKETGYWLKKIYGQRYYAMGYEFHQGNTLGFDFIDNELVFREITIEPSKYGTLGFLLSTLVGQDCYIDLVGKSIPEWFNQKQLCSDLLGCYGQKGCNQRYTKVIIAESYDGIIYIDKTEAANKM